MSKSEEGLDESMARIVRAFGTFGTTAPLRDANLTNKRLHVKLNRLESDVTRIMIRKHWGGTAAVKNTPGSLWKSFGTVSDVFYDEEYTYYFLSFPTHEEAAMALANLNNDSRILTAIRQLILAQGEDPKSQHIANQIMSHLVSSATLLGGKRASWARHRRSHYHSDKDFNGSEYDDDCPDGCDRDEWRAYSEGRD
jgi:hypothetical protein